MTPRHEVYEVLDDERSYQIKRHNQHKIPHRDEDHSIADWLIYIEEQLNEAKRHIYNLEFEDAMTHVRKLTALGVTCMEYKGAIPRR